MHDRAIAYVNRRAISAGALIALAAQHLIMAPGSTIGAATPVEGGRSDAQPQPVSEKTMSYVRKEFGATAESRDRPVLIAEAMVDPDIAVRGVVDKGKLLTLTTAEAVKHKVADARADTLQVALDQLGIESPALRHAQVNWAERVVRFLTHPLISSLLATLGMVDLIIALRSPGFGTPRA
jgi:membrane-bound serine protease (ClpP class)